MSQIERVVYEYMMANPAIKEAYQMDLINRRALARHIIKQDTGLEKNQFEAVIAMLRRMQLEKTKEQKPISLKGVRVQTKDNVVIVNLNKSKELIKSLERMLAKISYEQNETFKMVLGTSSIKVFLDEKNLELLERLITKRDIIYTHDKINEISLQFPAKVSESRGVLSFVTSSLAINDVVVEEFLSCSPELLIYVNDDHALKAIETIKKMQKD
jgi:hypothetical protein